MRKKLIRLTTALVAVVFSCSSLIAQYPGSKRVPQKWATGLKTINEDDARTLLGALAGPDFRGRSPRNADYAAAAGYVTSLLRLWGLKPAGDNGSYFQRFTTEIVTAIPEETTFESTDDKLRLEFMKDFSLRAYESFESSEQIAFLRVPKGADISQLDLSAYLGKVVALRPEIATENRDAYRLLVDKWGAQSRVRIVVPVARPELLRRGAVNRVKGVPSPTTDKFAALSLTAGAAQKMATFCGASNYIADNATVVTIETCPREFRLTSKVALRDDISSFNVVAKIEGSDSVLRDEYVAIGAHLDHFGATGQEVRWGADDNASGVTAAMLIARAIQQNRVRPRRSIIIGLWAMEESGLLGSWNYVSRPSAPIEKTVAYLNMDQVGRDEEDPRYREKAVENTTSVYLGSVKFNSDDLFQLLLRTNAFVNLRLKPDQEDRTLRSDTASFYRKGVPTLKAFTGEHPDYHRESDTAEKVNYLKLTNIAKWLYLTTMELTTQPERPRFEKMPFEPWTLDEAKGAKFTRATER